MNIAEIIKSSLIALGSNKVRSFLTMLGIIIGVAAVILLVSIGKGLQNYISDQFEAIGSNLLFVTPGKIQFGRDPGDSFSRNKLEEKHVKLIKTHAPDAYESITPFMQIGDTVKYKTKNYFATVVGMNEDKDIFSYSLQMGHTFTRTDVKSKARVAILGDSVYQEFFPNQNPMGKKIKIGGESYTVIGVLTSKGRNYDYQVVVPYTSALDTFNVDKLSSIVLKIGRGQNMSTSQAQIKRALLKDLKEDDFTIMSQEDILSSITSILHTLTVGLGVIAGISLLVGGIGIMNIMLVSVTERTKEIGLRKAVGATSTDIAMQFLSESTILSITGGLIGIILGWLFSFLGRSYIRTEVPWWSVAIAFSFAAFVGIIFGTYPAIKASKKDPIEALRYE